MLGTGLEFAPGTAEECKKLVVGMFEPRELFDAYRKMRFDFNSADIVLGTSVKDREILAWKRSDYAASLRLLLGKRASTFALTNKSAHSVVQMPFDADAFWLVIVIPGQELPSMCVMFATKYEVGADVVDRAALST